MDSVNEFKVNFEERACLFSIKTKKKFKKFRMSPKNIFNQSNVNLGYNLTRVTWVNLGLIILEMI